MGNNNTTPINRLQNSFKANTQRMMKGAQGLKENLQARGQQFIQQGKQQLAQQGTKQLTQGEITKNDKIINAIDLLTKQLKGAGEYKSKKHNRTKKHKKSKKYNRTKKHKKSKKHNRTKKKSRKKK